MEWEMFSFMLKAFVCSSSFAHIAESLILQSGVDLIVEEIALATSVPVDKCWRAGSQSHSSRKQNC